MLQGQSEHLKKRCEAWNHLGLYDISPFSKLLPRGLRVEQSYQIALTPNLGPSQDHTLVT